VRAYQSDQANPLDAMNDADALRSQVLYLSLPPGGISQPKKLTLQ
jgi:hypothetical protein